MTENTKKQMREILTDTLRLHLDIELIKKKLENQDKNIALAFNYLDELMENNPNPHYHAGRSCQASV